MSADTLQKVFKTFSDPTRVRILWLLGREELAVQELMEVLGMAQSRVSRHLAILREAGLLQDRRDGTYVFYRLTPPPKGPWRDTWAVVQRTLDESSAAERDTAALARVLEARAARTRSLPSHRLVSISRPRMTSSPRTTTAGPWSLVQVIVQARRS